jgi:hypothetical protein
MAITIRASFLTSCSTGDDQLMATDVAILFLTCILSRFINKNNSLGMRKFKLRLSAISCWVVRALTPCLLFCLETQSQAVLPPHPLELSFYICYHTSQQNYPSCTSHLFWNQILPPSYTLSRQHPDNNIFLCTSYPVSQQYSFGN